MSAATHVPCAGRGARARRGLALLAGAILIPLVAGPASAQNRDVTWVGDSNDTWLGNESWADVDNGTASDLLDTTTNPDASPVFTSTAPFDDEDGTPGEFFETAGSPSVVVQPQFGGRRWQIYGLFFELDENPVTENEANADSFTIEGVPLIIGEGGIQVNNGRAQTILTDIEVPASAENPNMTIEGANKVAITLGAAAGTPLGWGSGAVLASTVGYGLAELGFAPGWMRFVVVFVIGTIAAVAAYRTTS